MTMHTELNNGEPHTINNIDPVLRQRLNRPRISDADPENRIRRPKIAANKARPCDEQSLKRDYEEARKKRENYPAIVSGQLKFISLSGYIKRRIDCYNCDELTCPVWQGCCGWMKLIYENTECPKVND